jgi:hypothetical protein
LIFDFKGRDQNRAIHGSEVIFKIKPEEPKVSSEEAKVPPEEPKILPEEAKALPEEPKIQPE